MIQGKQVTGILHQGGDRFGAPYVYGSLDAFNVVLKAGGRTARRCSTHPTGRAAEAAGREPTSARR